MKGGKQRKITPSGGSCYDTLRYFVALVFSSPNASVPKAWSGEGWALGPWPVLGPGQLLPCQGMRQGEACVEPRPPLARNRNLRTLLFVTTGGGISCKQTSQGQISRRKKFVGFFQAHEEMHKK